MKIEDAKNTYCLRCSDICKADKCMAWLLVNPDDDQEGVCMYLGLTTALMKIMHLASQMIVAPKSNIIK
jgi:hypothetical protein